MAENEPYQKRISHRYDGAADYLRRSHYFRRLRLWIFALAVVASILGALAFSYWGGTDAYSPGPVSRNHSHLDCRVCHLDADRFSSKLGKFAPVALLSQGADDTEVRARTADGFVLRAALWSAARPRAAFHTRCCPMPAPSGKCVNKAARGRAALQSRLRLRNRPKGATPRSGQACRSSA